MAYLMRSTRHLGQFISMLPMQLADGLRYMGLCLRWPASFADENIFLRNQLALCQERSITPGVPPPRPV
jgi:hypothetical protein